jgi:hypothetical protein
MNTTKGIPQPWLNIARGAWILLALYNLLPGLLGLPAYFRQLVAMNPWPANGGWNPENFHAAFSNSGFDPRVAAWLVVIPAAVQMIITVSLGLLVFWRRSHEWFGLVTSYCLVGLGGIVSGIHYEFIQAFPPFWQIVAQEVGVMFWLGFFMFMILFPNGRFIPHWMRWVAAGLAVWFVMNEVYTKVFKTDPIWLSWVVFIIFGFILYGKYMQNRWMSSPQEKQQIRWFLAAIVVFVMYSILQNLYDSAFPILAQPGSKELIIYVIRVYLGKISVTIIPISVAIAIFRYHLWDIDLIIRRTLAYTVLTVLLGLVYFGLVTLMQTLFVGASGQQSTLALVISTLVIAALFNPLRRRIQQIIDKRFFRQKYDSASALEEFSTSASREVDLSKLTDDLTGVVQKTIQPEQVSVWLRKAAK